VQGISDVLRLGPSDRISLYREAEGSFELVTRFSRNPSYYEPRRTVYPCEQGIIWEAYCKDSASDDGLPDPNTDMDEYCAYLERNYRIPPAASRELRMKSRAYEARAVRDTQDRTTRGVLVVETTRPAFDNKDSIQRLLGERALELRGYLHYYENTGLSIARAREEGF
jgi:hypothetical protein